MRLYLTLSNKDKIKRSRERHGDDMLHIANEDVRKHILDGHFGLEKESLRILENGTLSHSVHPFPDDVHIVKDFCENQTEINTSVHNSAEEAIEELKFHNRRIYERLQGLQDREYLWPFSNPPYIEKDGGYVLKYPPEKYTVGQILKVAEGDMAPTDCVSDFGGNCENKGVCVSYRLWKKLDDAIDDVLEGITLADMLEWQTELQVDQYVI